MLQEWLWQTEEFVAEWLTFMVSLKHVNDHPPGLTLSVGPQVTYGWQHASGMLFFFSKCLMFTPILPRNTQRKHETVEIFHACNLCLITLWMDDFLRLFWASHVQPALSWSVHGHNSADALWGPGMLRLWGGCFSCLCNSSLLLCLSLRMAFPSAGDPSGTPPYILSVVALVCLLENRSICPLRKWSAPTGLSVAHLKKHQCPLPPINICVFMSMRAEASGSY